MNKNQAQFPFSLISSIFSHHFDIPRISSFQNTNRIISPKKKNLQTVSCITDWKHSHRYQIWPENPVARPYLSVRSHLSCISRPLTSSSLKIVLVCLFTDLSQQQKESSLPNHAVQENRNPEENILCFIFVYFFQ